MSRDDELLRVFHFHCGTGMQVNEGLVKLALNEMINEAIDVI